MNIFLSIIVLFLIFYLIILAFVKQEKFGSLPKGNRKTRVLSSPNYRNNKFQNINPTPQMAEDASFLKIFKKFFFEKSENRSPKESIPSIKTNWDSLDLNKNQLVWFGHSSSFLQIEGKRFLIDPVFSKAVTPMPFGMKAFKGTDIFSVENLPKIDYLIITHDHWDHLDFKTVKALKDKIQKVICPLGVGAHLERWGYKESQIIEEDWNTETELETGFSIYTLPARHFSGRGTKANQSLWASFVVKTSKYKIFIGGDGGYDTHFKEIGERFGGFDLAIIENGQYNTDWKYIHLLPPQVIQAAIDLQTKAMLPVHSCKFSLSLHAWDEPLNKLLENANEMQIKLITPKIGEIVSLADNKEFKHWWKIKNFSL